MIYKTTCRAEAMRARGDARLRRMVAAWLTVMVVPIWAVPTSADEPDGAGTDPPPAVSENGDDEADDGDLSELSLEELMAVPVVVTAGRHAQRASDVPYAVTVITAKEIRRSGARNVADALRLAAGVDVAELSWAHAAVSPRGFHGFLGRQVLVLVDGRQIFDSLFGGTIWSSWPVMLEDIDRIEVIRGPGGVAWGANAVNGVINVITKDPREQEGLTLSMSGGSRGYHGAYVGLAEAGDRYRFRLSLAYAASDGFVGGGAKFRGLRDDYLSPSGAFHGVIEATERDTVTLSFGSAVIDGGYPTSPVIGPGAERHAGSEGSYMLGKWQRVIAEDNEFSMTLYVNDYFATPGARAIEYRYQQLAYQFNHSFRSGAHTVTWGVDTRFDLLDGRRADPQLLVPSYVDTGIIGAYLTDDWALSDRLTLSLGGRVDYEFYGGFQPSARASASYHLGESGLVYGSVSRAFQMPPVGLRFMEFPVFNGLAAVQGNRDVDVETLTSFELGYRGSFHDKLDVSAAVFWNEFDDLTVLRPQIGPVAILTQRLDNLAEASLVGAELEARYAVSDALTLVGNYTYQHINWRSRWEMFHKDTISVPAHKAMIGAYYAATDDIHLSSLLYYVDEVEVPRAEFPLVKRRIDEYFRLDVKAEFEFLDDRLSFGVGVRNLLDSRHPEGGTGFLNYGEVPTTVFGELRWHLP